jgi:sodium-coupled neutral amino acid transporter 11
MKAEYNEISPLLQDSGVVLYKENVLTINHAQEPQDDFAHAHGDPNKKISSKFAIWNLFNDVLSPGTVALPFYIYQAGLPAGCLLIVLFGLLTAYTLDDVYMLYMKYGKKSYPELCDFAFGKIGYAVVCLAIFCFNFGGLCAQLMLFGSVVPDILSYLFPEASDLFTKRNLILMGCIVFLPISFLKDIAKYTFTSFVSVSCVFIITGLVVFRLIDREAGDFVTPGHGSDSSDSQPYALVHESVFSALGGLAYIYVCHDLSFNVIGSLESPTKKRYRQVIFATMGGTVVSCLVIGVSGYLLFFDMVNTNILQSFPRKDLVATIGRTLLAIDVTMTIPFTCFMPRISIIATLSAMGPGPKKWAQSTFGFAVVTVFVLSLAVVIAIFVDNLGDVFELVGGVSACTLAFLLPPLLVMKQVGLRNLSFFRKVMTIVTLIGGLVILFGSTIDIFL